MSEIERPTQNSARTVRTYPLAPAAVLDAVLRAVEGLPRWSISSRGRDEAKAIRATRLLRFKDDVTVRVGPHETGTRAEFTSASWIGKGDLGQNPRNLQQLLQAIDREMDVRTGP